MMAPKWGKLMFVQVMKYLKMPLRTSKCVYGRPISERSPIHTPRASRLGKKIKKRVKEKKNATSSSIGHARNRLLPSSSPKSRSE